MPQVKLGPQFFKNELRVYRDWAEAFWRENLQNSFDAGATRIDITIADTVEGVSRITFADNGGGMDEKVLEDIYFTLGETSKTGPDSVGGFGKARILTCFAQKGYELFTNDLHVVGTGADYEIGKAEAHNKGVRLVIDVFDKGRDLTESLKGYLHKSHLSGTQVYVNGERFTEWTYKGQRARDLSFGTLHTNKSKSAGILVRVNGVHMFSPYTSAPFLVVLEIDQARSREVLQASRDGLLGEFQRELESFLADLNTNKRSALREKRRKNAKFEGTGTFTTRKPIVESDEIKALREEWRDNPSEPLPQSAPEGRYHAPSSIEVEEETIEDLTFDLFNVIVQDETENAAKRKVIDSYNPMNWDLLGKIGTRFDKRYGETRSFRAGVEKYKLLVLWKAACEQAIVSLYNVLPSAPDTINWGVGWVFSDQAEAMHLRDGVHWLMIDPTTAKGNMKFSLANTDSLGDIFKLAAHEVVHVVCGDHDENYANVLTDVMGDGFKRKTEVMRFMKDAKSDAERELDQMVERNAQLV